MSSAQPASFANDDNNIGIQAGQFIAHGPINVVQQTQDALGQLPRVADALFNSLAKQHQPICLENTRIELLNRIYNWAEGHDQRHLFWLCGLAGTGKSTIARTVARKYHDKQRLAASFFFSRDSEDTKHARHFVTTIALQLAGSVPALKPYISNAVLKQRDIANQALRDQWHDLVHDPLLKLHDDGPITLILVIDALDECENREDILVIIQLLASAQSYPGVQLRLLLTSRPEMPIRNAFSQLLVEHHSISPAADGHDVGLFLEDRFRHIAERSHQSIGWPGKNATEQLRQSASGLFIWAETAWRYIYGGQKKGLVQNRLQTILQNRRPASGPEAQLDRIYNTVLDSAVSILDEEDQDYFQSQLRYVLGTIVILLSPLSVPSLGKLLKSGDVVPEDELDGILEDLHAILDIPTDRKLPLRLHHPSFRDFLLHETRCHKDFRVEGKMANSHIWQSCIQLMSRSLQQNICKVKRHGIIMSEVEVEKVEWYIPLELQYACRYWAQHLAKSGAQLSDSDQVHSFLQEHFLHWLEVLGWIGKVAEGIHAIISLKSMILINKCPELFAFIHDMKRFAQYNLLAIEQDPLQVYCSGLVFAPNRSIIKRQFRDKIPKWITKLPHVNSNWGTLLQTLEGHTDEITVLAFSPNGKVLASGSDDCTIRLWDVETGAILQILQGHSDSVTAVAFTPYDSKVLASASNYGTVRLWNTSTGELLQTLSVLSEHVKILTFSPDHKVLALVQEDRTVELWDWETNTRLQVRSYGADWVSAVVFSRDGRALALVSDFGRVRLMDIWKNVDVYAAVGSSHEMHQMAAISSHGEVIASVSTDESLTLWNADTDTITKIPRDDAGKVSEVALSPNGGLLASLSPDRTIKLWEAGTGKLVQTVDEFSICEGPLVFSPTNKVLGYTSANTVKLWKADTGTVVHMLEGHSSSVTTMAFSPNSNVLASGSGDETVKLWEVGMDGLPETFQDRSGSVRKMVFSPDGKLLASVSGMMNIKIGEMTVKLWNTGTGVVLHTFKAYPFNINAMAFSYDSKQLAIPFDKTTIKIWDTSSGACLQMLFNHCCCFTLTAFSHDSRRLASASKLTRVPVDGYDDDVVRVWDVSSGLFLATLVICSGRVEALVFSPNNDVLASVSSGSIIEIWEVHTGKLLHKLWDHSDNVEALAFSPKGMFLVSASADRTVKLWNVHQGKLLNNLSVGVDVSELSFSKDASFIHTNHRIIPTGLFIPSSPQQIPLVEVFVRGQWLFYQGSRQLWLPPEYRATYVAVYGRMVALGHESGWVSFIVIAS